MRDYTQFMEPGSFSFITQRIDDEFPRFKPRKIKYLCVIFEILRQGVDYHKSGRKVPSASQMMDRLSGDCEDQGVLINSMFEAAGLNSAFLRTKVPRKTNGHIVSLVEEPLGDINETCRQIRRFYLENYNITAGDIHYDQFNGKNWIIADNFSNYPGHAQALINEDYIKENGSTWRWNEFKEFLEAP